MWRFGEAFVTSLSNFTSHRQRLRLAFSKLKVGIVAAIARRNLELCFPEMPEQEREAILQENLRAVGMAIIETGMAWFWSDARIKKWSKLKA